MIFSPMADSRSRQNGKNRRVVQAPRLHLSVVGDLRRPHGAWDYGPLGVELKRNLKDYWWRSMTQLRDDIVGFDGSILMNRAVWQASGHESTFSDPRV